MLNDQDISSMVQNVEIEAHAGSMVITKLTLIAAPVITHEDGEPYTFRLQGGPVIGPLAPGGLQLPPGLKIRAMTLTGDIPNGT